MSLAKLRTAAATILLAFTLAMPAAAAPDRASLAAIRIDNFGRINDNYFRGAQPEGRDYADLRALGVRTIIDLTDDGDLREGGIVQDLGMKFFRIPMSTHETPSSSKVARFLELVDNPANQPVYVHCQGGRHRTGVMTAVYRIADEGWTANRAAAEMKQYKFGPDLLHMEFARFVQMYRPEPPMKAVLPATAAARRES
ncbi:MAG TPA: dual specificity protein phosphatase family protein [Vicinamibacterales bacterium]|nr:dual specificity protein phosphatase family protein [Vicinamibacterales bacterium]